MNILRVRALVTLFATSLPSTGYAPPEPVQDRQPLILLAFLGSGVVLLALGGVWVLRRKH